MIERELFKATNCSEEQPIRVLCVLVYEFVYSSLRGGERYKNAIRQLGRTSEIYCEYTVHLAVYRCVFRCVYFSLSLAFHGKPDTGKLMLRIKATTEELAFSGE